MATTEIAHCLEESIDARRSGGFLERSHLARYEFARRHFKVRMDLCLDAACGHGYGLPVLADIARRVVGIDICQEALDYARMKYSREGVSLIRGDINEPGSFEPFRDSVDVLTSFETLEHCLNPDRVLSGFYKALKFGGVLFLSVPNGSTEARTASGRPLNPYHVSSFSEADLRKLVKEAGFDPEKTKVYGQGQLLYFLRQIKKTLKHVCGGSCLFDAKIKENIKGLIGGNRTLSRPLGVLVGIADNLVLETYKSRDL